ncbi:MAG: hypothetical protein P8N92_07990 [Burkholderiales bacterium]|nr:hypothetical protein [Burkholderiales bacterium]
MRNLLFSILVTTIAAVILIGYLLAPTDASLTHWVPYLWLSILFYLNWQVSVTIFAGKGNDSIFGILPSAGLVVFFASVISASAAFVASYADEILSRAHLVFQVLAVTLAVILFLTFNVSSRIASSHKDSVGVSRRQVLESLRVFTVRQDDELLLKLREVINVVEYDLPHESKLHNQPSWAEVSSEILACGDINETMVANWLQTLRKL